MSSIEDVNLETFDAQVIQSSKQQPVIVDLWADWCSPCLVIAPLLKQLVKEFEGGLKLAKVEVDDGENMKLAGQYQVRGFPTIILFIHGKEVDRFSGAKPLLFLREFVQRNIGSAG